MIDLSIFARAILKLEEAINMDKTEIVRDSVVQRFEYTYELSISIIRRYILEKYISDKVDIYVFQDVIRTALQLEIIKSDLEKWSEFRKLRNKTSHTYNEKIAEDVYQIAKVFLEEVKFVYKAIQSKL